MFIVSTSSFFYSALASSFLNNSRGKNEKQARCEKRKNTIGKKCSREPSTEHNSRVMPADDTNLNGKRDAMKK